MKKNTMMRIASVLLVAVLLSTCTISGTFAKYVTEGSTMDSARVAEWGVVITGETGAANQMFSPEYQDNDDKYNGLSVAAEENVVAPGTDGTMSKFTISGKPEVATRITFSADVELGEKWAVNGSYYCPLIVKVSDNTVDPAKVTVIKGLDYTNATAFEAAIEAAIVAITKDYAPNADLSAVQNDIAISWEWPFVNPTDAALQGTAQHQSDAKDTALGNLIGAAAPTIQVKVTCVATQID